MRKGDDVRQVIDAHCHIYPDKIAEKAAAAIGAFYDISMRYDGRLTTLLQAEDAAGIGRSLVFSVATKPTQTVAINQYIVETVARYEGRLLGLGTIHPDNTEAEAHVAYMLAHGLRGVKLHPDIQGTAVDDKRCMRIYAACEGRLPVLLHTGDSRYDFSNPERLLHVLDRFPALTVIGAHFGGYSVWQEAAKQLAGRPNLYVDCSSSLFAMSAEEGRRLVHAYGADRVLFGTDYPMWSPTEELERFDAMELTERESEQILHGNAEKLFGFEISENT